MSKEIAIHTPKELWSSDQLRVIKNLVAPGLTDDELVVFAHYCRQANLDPFARQIYAIKRGGRMCVQTSIDGFRLVAERSGRYSPGRDTEFLYDDNKRLMGAKVFVKKQTPDGTWHEISATAFLSEYRSTQGLWNKMPSVMIEKCAEARALRRAFPADLSNMYSDDEMDQADAPALDQKIPEDPKITDERVEEIEKYLNGLDDLKGEILKLCQVSQISDIKESQLEACKNFVNAKKEAKKNAIKNEEKQQVQAV